MDFVNWKRNWVTGRTHCWYDPYVQSSMKLESNTFFYDTACNTQAFFSPWCLIKAHSRVYLQIYVHIIFWGRHGILYTFTILRMAIFQEKYLIFNCFNLTRTWKYKHRHHLLSLFPKPIHLHSQYHTFKKGKHIVTCDSCNIPYPLNNIHICIVHTYCFGVLDTYNGTPFIIAIALRWEINRLEITHFNIWYRLIVIRHVNQ